MFNSTQVQEKFSRLGEQQSDTLKYKCRLARFHNSVSRVFDRELTSSAGWIPESSNTNWRFPVVQYFQMPENKREPMQAAEPFADGDLCQIDFIRESRQDGEGIRNVVRIYRLPDSVQSSKEPEYWLRAYWINDAEKISPILVKDEWLDPNILGYANNCRFAVMGSDQNLRLDDDGNQLYESKNFAVIGIAMSEKPVAVQVWRNSEIQTVEY